MIFTIKNTLFTKHKLQVKIYLKKLGANLENQLRRSFSFTRFIVTCFSALPGNFSEPMILGKIGFLAAFQTISQILVAIKF